jgi:hypothetical protein
MVGMSNRHLQAIGSSDLLGSCVVKPHVQNVSHSVTKIKTIQGEKRLHSQGFVAI